MPSRQHRKRPAPSATHKWVHSSARQRNFYVFCQRRHFWRPNAAVTRPLAGRRGTSRPRQPWQTCASETRRLGCPSTPWRPCHAGVCASFWGALKWHAKKVYSGGRCPVFSLLLHTEAHTFAYTAHTSYMYIHTYTPLNAKPHTGPVYSCTCSTPIYGAPTFLAYGTKKSSRRALR